MSEFIKVKAPTPGRRLNVGTKVYIFDDKAEAILPLEDAKHLPKTYSLIGKGFEDSKTIPAPVKVTKINKPTNKTAKIETPLVEKEIKTDKKVEVKKDTKDATNVKETKTTDNKDATKTEKVEDKTEKEVEVKTNKDTGNKGNIVRK